MKKALVVLLFIGFVYTGFAQRKVNLAVRYLPGRTYTGTNDQITKLTMEIGGDKETTKRPGGDGKPVKKSVLVHTEKETTTGSLYNDSLFLLKTVLTKVSRADGPSAIPDGTAIYGKCSTTGRMSLDSMSSEGMDPELKEKLLPMLKTLMQSVQIPEHTLRVGESFTFKTPLSLPLNGITLDFTISTTYKLKSIEGGIANFDMVQDYVMSSESVAIPITASGKGKGSMTYDINNSYYTKNESYFSIDLSSKAEGRSMQMKMESTSLESVEIKKN